MITVSKLADRTGLTPDTVRHYARIGILKPERNPKNGYKLFSNKDIDKLKFVGKAKSLGFTLNEIIEIIDINEENDNLYSFIREIVHNRIRENKTQLEALALLQERMEHAVELWDAIPEKRLKRESVYNLIEMVKP